MEKIESIPQESGFLAKIISRVFGAKLKTTAETEVNEDVSIKLFEEHTKIIRDLTTAKESEKMSASDITIIDSWIFSLENYTTRLKMMKN